jgi:hypothetical protein
VPDVGRFRKALAEVVRLLDEGDMVTVRALLFKSEQGERFDSDADPKEKVFDYIEVFYNQ